MVPSEHVGFREGTRWAADKREDWGLELLQDAVTTPPPYALDTPISPTEAG